MTNCQRSAARRFKYDQRSSVIRSPAVCFGKVLMIVRLQAFAADSCSDLLVFLLDMNNAPFVSDSVFISLSLIKGAYHSPGVLTLSFYSFTAPAATPLMMYFWQNR